MTDDDPDLLQRVVEGEHGGKAVWVAAERFEAELAGETVWQGTVHVFNLDDHPGATMAYAWSLPIEGSNKRRFFAVLHLGDIRCALDAVRAATLAGHKRGTVDA